MPDNEILARLQHLTANGTTSSSCMSVDILSALRVPVILAVALRSGSRHCMNETKLL